MFNVRLAGGHLYGKQLFTWLSLVMSFLASFMLSFFPLDVLDGIWDLIESVSDLLSQILFPFYGGNNSGLLQKRTRRLEKYATCPCPEKPF